MVATLVACVLAGVLVGVLSGMLGIGGGCIMVPLFRLGFGLPPLVCTATSLFAIVPTSLTGGIAHVRGRTCVPALGIAAGLAGACTSPLGVWLASNSADWVIMLVAALLISYSALTMFRKALRLPSAKAAAAEGAAAAVEAAVEVEAGADAEAHTPVRAVPSRPTRKQMAICALAGIIAGLGSGFIGVGGGFIMVPIMLAFGGIDMKLASGTSLVGVMILAIPGAITQCLLGNVDYLVGVTLALGSIPGAILGARLVRSVPERALRLAFAGMLLVAAVLLVVKQ